MSSQTWKSSSYDYIGMAGVTVQYWVIVRSFLINTTQFYYAKKIKQNLNYFSIIYQCMVVYVHGSTTLRGVN